MCSENNINLELITFIKSKDYNKEIIKSLKQANSHVFCTWKPGVVAMIYFFFITLFSKKIVIHFKQTTPGRLTLLKKIFSQRIAFITDLEGDKISEARYLMNVPEDKNSLDKNSQKAIDDLIAKEHVKLSLFDFIFVYNHYFENLIRERYADLSSRIKVAHLMSFRRGSLVFSENIRRKYRDKLRWKDSAVITYVGNVYYPWQNISKTIRIYKRIRDELNLNAKLLLLINKKDHPKALEFIKKYNLSKSDYCLMEVRNDEINGYLNASDVGIVLRDFHEMNKVVTSGKLLDYLGCGLPIISTSVLMNFSNNTKFDEYGVILNDLNIENISMSPILDLLQYNGDLRKRLSDWSNDNLSLDAASDEYLTLLKAL